jgi:hypothetical protein
MIDGYLLSLRFAIGGWVFLGAWTGLHASGVTPPLPEAVASYVYAALGTITMVAFIGKLAADARRRRNEASEPLVEAIQQGYELGRQQCEKTCIPKPDAKILAFPIQRDATSKHAARPAVGASWWVDPNDSDIPTVILPQIRELPRRPSPRSTRR